MYVPRTTASVRARPSELPRFRSAKSKPFAITYRYARSLVRLVSVATRRVWLHAGKMALRMIVSVL